MTTFFATYSPLYGEKVTTFKVNTYSPNIGEYVGRFSPIYRRIRVHLKWSLIPLIWENKCIFQELPLIHPIQENICTLSKLYSYSPNRGE